MTPYEQALWDKLRVTRAWILCVGFNVLAILTYLYLWVDNPNRLSVILCLIPIQIMANVFLLRPGVHWNRQIVLSLIQGFGILFAIYWDIGHYDWILTSGIIAGCAMLSLQIKKLRKRIGSWS